MLRLGISFEAVQETGFSLSSDHSISECPQPCQKGYFCLGGKRAPGGVFSIVANTLICNGDLSVKCFIASTWAVTNGPPAQTT
jgi:hypothetical protein